MNNSYNPNGGISSALQAGDVLDHYIIQNKIGQGGFGITYLAKEKLTGRVVVIKENFPRDYVCRDYGTKRVIPDGADSNDAFLWARNAFLQEACTLNELDHKNIVKVLSVFEANDTVYFTMPYLEGTSLQKAYEEAPISEAALLTMLHTLLDALQHLHDRELTHRDIKPDNILLTKNNVPILIDFGAARHIKGAKNATQIGTPGYAPPEQWSQTNYDSHPKPRIDLYALGATCYYLMTGEIPEKADARAVKDTMKIKLRSAELKQRFSKDLLVSIEKALELKPDKRWQSAREWLAALPVNSYAPQTKGNKKGLMAAAALIALAGVAYFATSSNDDAAVAKTANSPAIVQAANSPDIVQEYPTPEPQPEPQPEPTSAPQSEPQPEDRESLIREVEQLIEAEQYEGLVERLTPHAEQGYAPAQNWLGYCYQIGYGVPQNYDKAIEWYRKAANQGNADAQNNLGYCYKNGHGVPQNYAKAIEWYRKAADQGNSSAQNGLGTCYYNQQDYANAVEWLQKAANHGNATAQHNLGYCYENGHGVPRNYSKAIEWYQKAAEQGNADASAKLRRLVY